MGRFRSIFRRRVLKPLVMCMVAMGLSVSLVVTTPSNAQAFVPPAAVPMVLGATRMAIPALVPVASVLGPVGWGLLGVAAAVAVGVALYETRDTWVPWTEGDFGDGGAPDAPAPADADPNTEGEQKNTFPGLKIQNYRQSANGYLFDTYYSGSDYATGVSYSVTATLNCKRSDGTVYTEKKHWAKTFGTGWTTAHPRLRNFNDGYCQQSNHTLLGAVVGAYGSDVALSPKSASAYKGPENVVKHGDMLPGSFDPKSPETKYETSVECIALDGTKSTIKKEWTGDSPGMAIPSCEAAGKGHGTGKMWVDGSRPGVTQAPTRLWDNPAPQPTPGRELCAPTRAQQGCKLAVKIDGKECVMGLFECENWQEINQNDPGKDGTTPRVSCQYGPYSLPLDQCNPLERAYEKDGAPVSEPNIDGNPATRSDANLDGSPQPKPDPMKQAQVPGGAGAPVPIGTTPGTDAAKQAECFPTGWGMFNPLEWVYKPVVCAFKPSGNAQEKIDSVAPKFQNKAPFVWLAGGSAVVAGAASVSGSCPDWTINVEGLSKNVVCESSFTQAILSSRGALFGLMVIGMFWPLIRSIWYSVIPILRPAPIG